MTVVRDPVTGVGQQVTVEGEAVVRAIVEAEVEHASNQGLAYLAHSTFVLTGGEVALYIENEDSDKAIHIENVVVSTSAAGRVNVLEVTGGTATGTVLVPLNLNLGSAKVADVTAWGNAAVTGPPTGVVIAAHQVPTNTPFSFRFAGALIVPKDSAITVVFDTTATAVHVDMLFHFEDPSQV